MGEPGLQASCPLLHVQSGKGGAIDLLQSQENIADFSLGITHSAVSTGGKSDVFVERPDEGYNEVVSRVKAQNRCARGRRRVNREQFHALKAWEHPPHRRTCGGFLELIRNGVGRFGEARSQTKRGQARDQEAEDHQEAQRHDPFGLLDTDGGSQEQGICEKAKPTCDAALIFVRLDESLIGEVCRFQHGGPHSPTRVAQDLLHHLMDGDAHRDRDLPLHAGRRGIVARTTFASVDRMGEEFLMEITPDGLAFLFAFQRGAGIRPTSKAAVGDMPGGGFPLLLRLVHLSHHRVAHPLDGCLRRPTHPPVLAWWQAQVTAQPMGHPIFRLLPALPAFPQQSVGLGHGFRNAADPRDPSLIEPRPRCPPGDAMVRHRHAWGFITAAQWLTDGLNGRKDAPFLPAGARKRLHQERKLPLRGRGQGHHPRCEILAVVARRARRDGDDRRISRSRILGPWRFCVFFLLLEVVSTDGEGRGLPRDLVGRDAKDLASPTRNSRKEPGGIVRGEPVQRAPQAIVSEQVGGDSLSEEMVDWLPGKGLRDHRPLTIAQPPSIQDQGGRCGFSTHVLPIGRFLLISPARHTTLPTHSCHVVQPLIHRTLCCVHLASSSMMSLRSHMLRFLSMNCGMWDQACTCGLLVTRCWNDVCTRSQSGHRPSAAGENIRERTHGAPADLRIRCRTLWTKNRQQRCLHGDDDDLVTASPGAGLTGDGTATQRRDRWRHLRYRPW